MRALGAHTVATPLISRDAGFTTPQKLTANEKYPSLIVPLGAQYGSTVVWPSSTFPVGFSQGDSSPGKKDCDGHEPISAVLMYRVQGRY